MCTNGGFEQYETVSGSLKIKRIFLHTIEIHPTNRIKSIKANTAIPTLIFYDPNNTSVMATTVLQVIL
jgi:hypothetical protein